MATKRYPIKITPPTYEHVFERERLYNIVEQNKTCNTIWVNGPPGAGKTVFITSLLKKLKAKFLWYRIDSSENNLEDILIKFIQNCQIKCHSLQIIGQVH